MNKRLLAAAAALIAAVPATAAAPPPQFLLNQLGFLPEGAKDVPGRAAPADPLPPVPRVPTFSDRFVLTFRSNCARLACSG